MKPELQSERQCVLCTGCETDGDFDYCRACGFVVPVPNETARKYLNQHPMGSRLLAETIARAKGHQGPPYKPVSFNNQTPMTTREHLNALDAVLTRLYENTRFGILTVEDMKAMELGREALEDLKAQIAESALNP